MSKKIYIIGFYVLLVMNIALVVFLTQGPKPRPERKSLREKISQELNFDVQQRADFDEMAASHGDKIRNLDKEEKELITIFFDQLNKQEALGDTIKVETMEKIKSLKEQKIMVTYRHFEELKSLCKEDQLVKFDEVIKRLVPLFANPERRPPGKGRRPDRPKKPI